MKLAESVLRKFDEKKIEESEVSKIIKDLQDVNFAGDNEEQMKAVQLLKGLATSEDSMSNSFMKELGKHIKMIKIESLEEELRKDLKYRFKKDKDGKFDLQFQNRMGTWVHVRTFSDKAEGQKYLKDNMEK